MHTIRHPLGLLLAAVLVATAALPAQAFWKRADRDDAERPVAVRAVDPGRYPPMVFRTGTLRRVGARAWQLGPHPLLFPREATVSGPGGAPAALVDGRLAMVMGASRGGTLVAHHVAVFGFDEAVARGLAARTRVDDLPRPAPRSTAH